MIKTTRKEIKKAKKILEEAKIMSAYLEGYRHGLEEAKRIERNPFYAMSVLLKAARL